MKHFGAAIDALMGEAAVAIDTEFRRRDTFYPQVALIQIATQGQCWLIDPLTLSDPAPLKQLLLNPDVIKVLHSASEDLEVFERWLGVLPQPLFDSQKAAAMLNMGFGLSYRALVEQMLGTHGGQRGNPVRLAGATVNRQSGVLCGSGRHLFGRAVPRATEKSSGSGSLRLGA